MGITFVNNSATISTSEYSLPANTSTGVPTSQTDDCMLQGWIDFFAMAAGDEYEVKLYEKVNAGTQRLAAPPWILKGAPSSLFIIPAVVVGEGWDLTVKKLAGTDRSIGWSLRKVT